MLNGWKRHAKRMNSLQYLIRMLSGGGRISDRRLAAAGTAVVVTPEQVLVTVEQDAVGGWVGGRPSGCQKPCAPHATVRMLASPAAVVLTHHATDFGS
jgi:hypothetical protein